jgi:hypothetical protein
MAKIKFFEDNLSSVADPDPGSGAFLTLRSGSCFFTHPRFRGQKGTGSRFCVRNTATKKLFPPDPHVFFCLLDPDPDPFIRGMDPDPALDTDPSNH